MCGCVLLLAWIGTCDALQDGPAAAAPDPAAASAAQPLGEWDRRKAQYLVDLARHYGHLGGRDQPKRVTRQVLALMLAASEIDPQNADAWLWQFDLYSRMGRDADALDALTRYVALDPGNESAALQRLALKIASLQTAEARAEYLNAMLRNADLPRSVASDAHRRLAEYYRQRQEIERASQEIEQALRLMPVNLPARELAYEMFGETEPLLQRVELALQVIRISPTQVNVLWELGQLLDAYGMHKEAQEWYLRALEIHRRATSSPVDADHWYDLASSYSADGNHKEALKAITRALELRPTDVRVRLMKAYLAERAAEASPADAALRAEAAQELTRLGAEFEARFESVLKNRDAPAAAEMAWFYAFTRPDAQRAIKLAEVAMSAPHPDSLARRAYGFALLLNDRAEEAASQLAPLAQADQLAAYGYARALRAANRPGEAAEALQRGAHLRYSGMAFDLICAEIRKSGEPPPQKPVYPRITEALRHFDRRVFDFHAHPFDSVRLRVTLLDDPLPPVGPCRVKVRLENVNPPDGFAITLGEGLMVQPRVVLSAKLQGTRERVYRHYTEVLLNRVPVLMPGDAVEKTVAVDVGQLREDLIATAVTQQTLEVTAILNPVATPTGLAAGLGSVHSIPTRATRPAIPADRPAVEGMIAEAQSPSAPAESRIVAVQKLGALLAAWDRSGGRFSAGKVMRETGVDDVLVQLARNRDPLIAFYAIDALSWTRIRPDLAAVALGAGVTSPDLSVRLITVRLMGRLRPNRVNEVLGDLARKDPSPAVRELAAAFLPGAEAPAAKANPPAKANAPATADRPMQAESPTRSP